MHPICRLTENRQMLSTYFICMMVTARLKQLHMPLAECRSISNDTATKRLINKRLWCPQCTPVLLDWNRDAMIKQQTAVAIIQIKYKHVLKRILRFQTGVTIILLRNKDRWLAILRLFLEKVCQSYLFRTMWMIIKDCAQRNSICN